MTLRPSRLLRQLQRRMLPCAVERRGLGRIHSQVQLERSLRRGQPVGLPVLARRIVLHVERPASVGIALQAREQRRVDERALQRVRDEQAYRLLLTDGRVKYVHAIAHAIQIDRIRHKVIFRITHCQRPERIDRWQLAGREAQQAVALRRILCGIDVRELLPLQGSVQCLDD